MIFGADCFDENGPLLNGVSLVDKVTEPLWPDRQPPFKEMDLHILPYRSQILPTFVLNQQNQKYAYEMRPFGGPERWVHKPFQHVSNGTLQAVRDRRAVIVINDSLEGFPLISSGLITRLTQSIAGAGIPFDGVWFVTAATRADIVAADANCKFRVFCVDKFRYLVANKMSYDPKMFADPDQSRIAKRKKHYLCLNRQPRCHRVAFVSEIVARDLLRHGIVSFPGPDHWQMNQSYGTKDLTIDALRKVAPLIADQSDFNVNFAFIMTPEYYLQTFFSIVSETMFLGTPDLALFRSEKIYKPIANFHPFVLLGQHGMLLELKNLGFKTFSPFIDESYDAEVDDNRRMGMVIEETQRLCSIPLHVFETWYQSIFDDILLHNHNLLKNNPSIYLDLHAAIHNFVYK